MKLLTDYFLENFEKFKNNTAFIDNKTERKITYNDFKNETFKTVNILQEIIKKPQEKIILYLKPDYIVQVIDLAVMLSRNISVFCDYTYTFSEVEYVLNLTDSGIVFTDNLKIIKYFNENFSKPLKIFYVGDNNDFSDICNQNLTIYNLKEYINKKDYDYKPDLKPIDPSSVATILFSSGTTGKPKGVVYPHANITYSYLSHHKAGLFKKKGCCLSILSCSHIAPKLCDWSILSEGNYIVYSEYVSYKQDIKKFKPLYLMCVPKLLLMHHDDYIKALKKKSEKFRYFYNIFYKMSEKYVELRNKDDLSITDNIKKFYYLLWNMAGIQLFFGKILQELNIRKGTNIIAFGACLDIEIDMLYFVIGTKLLINYGLTEGGTLTYTNLQHRKLGSIGIVNPDVSLKIFDLETDEELPKGKIGLVKAKAPQIMKEYYNNPKATEEVFDKNGYLITGDIGLLTKDNFLFFKGRYKNIIVLNNGENINPEVLEELCKRSDFVHQILILGQDKPYLTAIIVPDKEFVSQWYEKNPDENLKDAILFDINNIIGSADYSKWIHQIKNIVIAEEEFSQENGLLTKKLGLNRPAIYKKYEKKSESLYNQK